MGATQGSMKMSLVVKEEVGSSPLATAGTTGSDPAITHALVLDTTITVTTAPVISKVVANEYALSSGAKTLDLSAIVATNGATYDMTGLRLLQLIVKNKTNSNALMTFSKGASNGYTGLGANFSIGLLAEQSFAFDGKTLAAAVSSTVKTIDVAGTGSQIFQLIATFGTAS